MVCVGGGMVVGVMRISSLGKKMDKKYTTMLMDSSVQIYYEFGLQTLHICMGAIAHLIKPKTNMV
jgi:hypothetical protein